MMSFHPHQEVPLSIVHYPNHNFLTNILSDTTHRPRNAHNERESRYYLIYIPITILRGVCLQTYRVDHKALNHPPAMIDPNPRIRVI